MSTFPRLLAIMGSGETSPTMVTPHRQLLARLGPPPVPAVLLDTPFGFQENADEITARAVRYFRDSVGQDMGVASYRSKESTGALEYETMLERLRRASYVFAGPGSPSYALRQWSGTLVPDVLGDKLRGGGCVTFASAAALTLGLVTVPVYEVYKVGEEPRWLEGLDLLAQAGLRAAVIPHYNNAEGGTHDTRYCYLGERRLRVMEPDLPDDAFILGVDEHTGCILDLDAGTATVAGLGVVTIRRRGRSTELPSGTTCGIEELGSVDVPRGSNVSTASSPRLPTATPARSPLLATVGRLEHRFAEAVAGGDVHSAAGAVLELDDELQGWAADTLQSDEMDRARAVLRSMVVRLGDLPEGVGRDAAHLVAPFVDLLVSLRDRARRERRWTDADAIRDRLSELGIDVRDTPEGPTWGLVS